MSDINYLLCGLISRIAALADIVCGSDEFHAPDSCFGVHRVVIGDFYREAGGVARVFMQCLPQILSAAHGGVRLCSNTQHVK
jgi:hypothetical protein